MKITLDEKLNEENERLKVKIDFLKTQFLTKARRFNNKIKRWF